MDSYVEVLVQREKNTTNQLLKILLYIVCAACVFFGIGGMPIMFIGAIAAALVAIFVVPPAELEYEYLYLGKELSIDKIIAKSKRKHVATYDLNKMEFMCPLNSHELDSYKNRNVKVKDYSSGSDNNPYVIVYHDENEEALVYVEKSAELISAIKTTMPRKVVEY